jgi:hypothetical protein
MNAATAITILNQYKNPSPVYYVHYISPGVAIVVRRAYINAPPIWFEWDTTEPGAGGAFKTFTDGYSPLQPHSSAPLSGRIVLDDCWGPEGSGPSWR